MSYIFNNQIAYSDSVNLDAFGRLRVSETRSLLELKYDQDKLPNQVDELVNGSASSTLDSTNACVIMSVSKYRWLCDKTIKRKGNLSTRKKSIV